jgi:hypothetical protein
MIIWNQVRTTKELPRISKRKTATAGVQHSPGMGAPVQDYPSAPCGMMSAA